MDRRTLLMAVAAGAISGTVEGAGKPWIIDTHTHFYDPGRPQGVPWPGPEDKKLYRSVLPPDYRRLAEPLGVAGTVVVEASAWVEDNQWVLDLAEREPFIVGLVGHLEPGTPDYRKHLKRFSKNRLFLGIRIGSTALRSGLLQQAYLDDLRQLADRNLELDINGGPDMLPDVARLSKEIPELRAVINHCANLRIDGRTPPQTWTDDMRRCAEGPKVYCKVSALVEGAGTREKAAPTAPEFYVPVLDVLWDAFGEDRLIYGSNWPVSEPMAPLAVVQGIVQKYFDGKGKRAAEKYFRTNAKSAYGWRRR